MYKTDQVRRQLGRCGLPVSRVTMKNLVVSLAFCCLVLTDAYVLHSSRTKRDDNEARAQAIFSEYDRLGSEKCYEASIAEWNYATNINDENEAIKLKISLENAQFQKEAWLNFTTEFSNWSSFTDPNLRRLFRKATVLGSAALPDDKLEELNRLETELSKTYSTTKVCSYENEDRCDLSLEPDLTEILSKSRNEEELRHVWTQWHDKSGNPSRDTYLRFVELSNEAARLNNFSDTGALWMNEYESDTFKDDLEELWRTLKPLYQELHAYVRYHLRDVYGGQIGDDGLIPAHLLGNMWAQSWENVYSLMVPYPGKASIDVTDAMIQQGYTPLKMFQLSDEFFTSLGMIPMPDEFWKGSLIEKPADREVICHASAWDLCNGKDYRVKQCTTVNTKQLIVVHHEMGHTQYQMQYKDLPLVYRTGANPGFHEAIGDAIALSVNTPKHLKEIGLLDNDTPVDDYGTTINFLFATALQRIAVLPFAFIIDKYRWGIFDGSVEPERLNAYWWQLRKEYQGLRPPNERSESNFDAGAKYHVPAHVEYTRYFVAHIIQFQFHRALCTIAGQYDPLDPSKPLHNCDIYRSKEAGAKLAAGLAMGASRPWPEVMQVITGQEKMDASAIREYFKPLEDWLKVQNALLDETPGWK